MLNLIELFIMKKTHREFCINFYSKCNFMTKFCKNTFGGNAPI